MRNRLVMWLATKYEKLLGRTAHASFCVSRSMQGDLRDNWSIESKVLYDKANLEIFKPVSLEEKHLLFTKLGLADFTQEKSGRVEHCKDRPMLLISATSWTKDEVTAFHDCQ